MMDVDHFRHYNDAYGHDAGDAALRAFGELLRTGVRAVDIACRYGGEESVLILPGATRGDTSLWTHGSNLSIDGPARP